MSPSGGFEAAAVVAERAIEAAAGSPLIVLVEDGASANVRFALNETTTNGVTRGDRQVTVVAFDGRSDGVAVGSLGSSGNPDVEQLVRDAKRLAHDARPADDASPLVSGATDNDFDSGPEETSLDIFAPLLPELAEAFGAARGVSQVLSGFLEHKVTTLYLATSTGIRRRHVQPTGAVQLVARSTDGTRSSWAGRGSADFSGVSIAEMFGSLTTRLGWAERRLELDAGRYEVVLPPDAVADLMADLAWAMSGREAEDGGTVFSREGGKTAIGEQLSEVAFRLLSDPSRPGLECTPFLATGASSSDVSVFDNGTSLEPVAYVEDGRLARLNYHRAGAKRSGQRFTAPADNLVLESPGATGRLEELIAGCDRGLLLTCLWYIREVDPATLLLTGLTRDGVYLIEHGEVVGAVNNFRFNESPLDVLAHSVQVGATTRALSREWNEYLNRTAMPPLRVADFNMSSVSPAN